MNVCTGLFLHHQRHVARKECERIKMVFVCAHYPETLLENTIRRFIEMKVTENACSKQQVSNEQDAPIRIAQFRYIKIQPKTIDLSTRLVGITTEFVGFIPTSLVLRFIVLG